ncbi:multiprotein-bridging factor 1 family protein [Streptomyces sp. NPDC050585]|uniref:multiprotein-bridging factor 1 family protein n=1 Tax=Streptomyces sp. NPDC050585 TaxID=3365632 RepID=UPI0037BCF6AE
MTGNVTLRVLMEAAGLGQADLAKRLNGHIERLSGVPGTVSDRHVRNWLTGKTAWPQKRQREALEAEFGVSAENLGFTPLPPRTKLVPRQAAAGPDPSESLEAPLKRRTFTAAATTLAAAQLLPARAGARPRVGMSDVARLETAFHDLVTSDNQQGGSISLETRAVAFAQHALEKQKVGTTTSRVRSRLYYLAAAFTGTALWAAIDSHQPERARTHLRDALYLADLSGSSQMKTRLWLHASLLASQEPGGAREALDAAYEARSTYACRSDALLRSLALARLAGTQAHAYRGERRLGQAALGNIDGAQEAFATADRDASRPAWISFYDEAELQGLSSLVMTRLGRHAEAEAHLHKTLRQLRPEYRRNRMYYTATLALVQLRQGEVELACSTAERVGPRGHNPPAGRTGQLLIQFGQELAKVAPGSRCVADWKARYRLQGEHRP